MEKKTIIYIRVSTQKQNIKGYSKYDQITECINYCKNNNIKNYEVYDDGGYSGKNTKRSYYNKMLEEIQAGEISKIITIHQDRLNRNSFNNNLLVKECQRHGVELKPLNMNVDINTPEGELTTGIISGVNQFESQQIGVRTSRGYRGMLKQGLYPWRSDLMPLGISKADDKTLYHNDDIEIVKKIFSLHFKGYSNLKIEEIIKSKYPRMHFHKTRIQKILTTTLYMGYVYHKGNTYNLIDPIITKNDLLVLEDLIDNKKKLKVRKKRIKYKNDYELSKSIKYKDDDNFLYCQTTRKVLKTTGEVREYKYYFSEDKKVKIRELYLLQMFEEKLSHRKEELKSQKQEQRYRIQKMLYKGQITNEEYKIHLQEIEKNFLTNIQMDLNIKVDDNYNITIKDDNNRVLKFNYLEELKNHK